MAGKEVLLNTTGTPTAVNIALLIVKQYKYVYLSVIKSHSDRMKISLGP